ncbi:MAG: glycosyltransferase family 2 protein [Pikeienuella sp.]
MSQDIAIYFGGGRMHFLHHLTLLSAVRRGHHVTVYAQGHTQNVPDCVVIKDIRTVVDPSHYARAAAHECPRLRGMAFQCELLVALDGVITMGFDHALTSSGPLSMQDGRLFGWQSDHLVGTGILALPRESCALATCLDTMRNGLLNNANATVWGSQLLTQALHESGEIAQACPKSDFYALDPSQVLMSLQKHKDVTMPLSAARQALPIYHAYLLPAMRNNFHGIPRYWSALGFIVRENGVTVRDALAFQDQRLPDRVWNEESRDFACLDWAPPVAPSVKIASPPFGTDASPATSAVGTVAPEPLTPPSPMPSASPYATTPTNENPLKVMIVTTMRNEAPFILEWVAYHRAIGVTDFVVYTNDCDDGTDELLDALAEFGLITARIDNPFREQKKAGDWQRAALWDLQNSNLTNDVDWLIPMDVDEYINIHTGQGTFADLVHAIPDAHMISMIWRLFGNGFVDEFKDRFVTEQFEYAALDNCARPALAWGFKTAFNPQKVDGVWSVHRPKKIDDQKDHLNWYLSTGQKMEERFFRSGWRADRKTAGYDLVSLNHYSLRSSESYLVKKHRGRVNHTKEDQDISYFFRMNHNVAPERSIQAKLPQAKALYAQFLQNNVLRALHDRGVAQHHARIESLKTKPDYQSLYNTVTSSLLQIYSRLTPHFGNWIFTIGPKSIPNDYEAWARDRFAGNKSTSYEASLTPPGMQPSGTILPKPEFLEEINENRKANLGEARALNSEIFQKPAAVVQSTKSTTAPNQQN